jgi:hypothetical protein
MRSFSAAVPCNKSRVHFTSAAVNGLPSCHLTPCRSGNVNSAHPRSSSASREFRNDRLGGVLRLVLSEDNEVIKDAHHRSIDRGHGFFEQRHAGRAVKMAYSEIPARLLRNSDLGGGKRD